MFLTMNAILSVSLLLLVWADSSFSSNETWPIIKVSGGLVQGRIRLFRGIQVSQFFCIPFGEPPIGPLRFKKPIPRAPWSDVLPAHEWGPLCMQPEVPEISAGYNQTEDCLCLNVFTPFNGWSQSADFQPTTEQPLLPVMVWFHGGGFNVGSANEAQHYDGTVLASLQNVVVVTVNYRLGPFGFLYLPEAYIPGNMGLWDQNLALRWVSENIKAFGGDSNQVTLFGESAGSMSVSAHLVSPASKGLFTNVIMQSGSIYDLARWSTVNITQSFLTLIGCPSATGPRLHSCLSSYQYRNHFDVMNLIFWPIIGDQFLPSQPEMLIAAEGIDPKINVLLGTVGNEGVLMLMMKDPLTFSPFEPHDLTLAQVKSILAYLFGPSLVDFLSEKYLTDMEGHSSDDLRLRLAKVVGDIILTCPTYEIARDLATKSGLDVYAYHQTQRPSQSLMPGLESSSWLPATHADDILPVFGYPFLEPDKYTREDVVLSSLMMNIWGSFSKTGKPPTLGPHQWHKWTSSGPKTIKPFIMELNSKHIGPSDPVPIVASCFENWPFPFEKPYNAKIEMGKLSSLGTQ